MADTEVLRVHAAAGLALVRVDDSGATRWVPWPPPPSTPAALSREPSIALDAREFAPGTHFRVSASADGHAPQNALVLLHGRGGDEAPFVQFGARMELPQTATIALRAPVELPFELGYTWLEDLDADFEVIPPDAAHAARSRRLRAAGEFLWAFVQTLHDAYAWPFERIFVLGFSQGACVAFDALMACAPRSVRLGGVVLVAGGFVAGPHAAAYTESESDAETPLLLVSGERDAVYPAALSERTAQLFKRRFRQALLTPFVARGKGHEMLGSSRDEMQQVMSFFSRTLYLRNFELEKRSDIVEVVHVA